MNAVLPASLPAMLTGLCLSICCEGRELYLDRGAALVVEEMHALLVERQADVLVRLDAHCGIHARHHCRAAGAEIDENLIAERLHHVHGRVGGGGGLMRP